MRLFAGLKVPALAQEKLVRLQGGLAGARWRPEENFHITLQFYDEVPEQNLPALEDALQQIRFTALDFRVSGLGTFGRKKPFVLWAGADGANTHDQNNLRELARNCFNAGRSAGIALQSSNYRPHITLAYCKNSRQEDIARYLQENNGFLAFDFTCRKFALYLSRLGKHPSRYEIIAEFPCS